MLVYPNVLVHDFLQNSASRQPEKVALVAEGRRLTYSALDQMANRLANALIDQGVRRGDRVAIYLPNAAAAVVGIFAALKAGGVFVVINPTTKADKLAYILDNCRAAALLSEWENASPVRNIFAQSASLKLAVLCGSRPGDGNLDGWPGAVLDFEAIQETYPAHRPPRVNIDLDLACLIYTSGSTGEPKGVMSDHSNVVFAASSIIEYLGNVPEDVIINVLPLSFDYGLYQLLMTFQFGGTLVLERSFSYPAATLKRMEEERVTGFPGVPTLFAILLRMDLSRFELSSLRYLSNTAASLPPSHIEKLREKFPEVKIFSMYGLTETKRTLYLPPEQVMVRPGSVGIPIPGTEAWLEDEAGRRLGAGETGELVVRGRHVMRGYWEDENASAARFRPGPIPGERLCYTGDLFRMDDEGYFYFVGRKDDVIKSRGEKVSPKEVENVIYGLKGVIEAAVVGVPDPVLGEAVKAFIVPDGNGLSESEVRAHCQKNLEDFMVPRYIEFCAALPKTTSGKIKKTGLGRDGGL